MNIEKLAQEYPALFIGDSTKRKREHKTLGQQIGGDTESPEEAFWKAFRGGFYKAPDRDKNLAEQS